MSSGTKRSQKRDNSHRTARLKSSSPTETASAPVFDSAVESQTLVTDVLGPGLDSDFGDSLPTHELELTGRGSLHRIVCGDVVGPWATYQQIAVLKIGERVYHAATDYFHGSLPTGVVFTTRSAK